MKKEKVKRLKSNEFLKGLKRLGDIDKQLLVLRLEREFLMTQLKPVK
jgi:hypothetical protein